MRKEILRAVIGALAGLLLVAPSAALAADVYVCIKWKPSFLDVDSNTGDDWIVTNPSEIPGYGAMVKVVHDGTGAVAFEGYASDVTGCTSSFTVTAGQSHTVKVRSEAEVNGNTLHWMDETGGHFTTAWTSVAWTGGSGTYTFYTSNTHMSRVMGIMSYALKYQSLGVTGETVNVYRKDDLTDTPCAETSCFDGFDIYIIDYDDPLDPLDDVDHTKFKFILAHELGHKMQPLRSGGCPQADYAYTYSGPCPDGAGHARTSLEWQSAAVNEGWAHFYATVVFNDTSGAGCGYYSHYWVNWDNNGPADSRIYDCDDAPVAGLGLSAGDWMGDVCGPTFDDGTANEYDYQRFFWDLATELPPGGPLLVPRDIADIIGDACTNPAWNTTWVSGSANNPVDRLYDAALSYGTAWDTHDDFNGVTR